MKGCTVEQARQLIFDRIALTFPDSADEKFGWLFPKIKGIIINGYSPRNIILLANRIITHEKETSTQGSDTNKSDEREIFDAVKSAYELEELDGRYKNIYPLGIRKDIHYAFMIMASSCYSSHLNLLFGGILF